ncbi:MAG: MBL fold metallo-hydrolase [Clostridia bacterium]|nr:MBL fold metallo-hydrolase [Clostridia bacterium]
MKIVVLAENTAACEGIGCEHGLSLYIEAAGQKILCDMGQSALFEENAKALGVSLSEVTLAVLSHGHYDHGGGLARFLALNEAAPVYMHKDAFLPHYNGTEKYIGLDTALAASPRIVFTEKRQTIAEGLTLIPATDIVRRYKKIPHGLTEKVGESFVEDDFRHEQYLLIEEAGKRVLISGCSHIGVMNIARDLRPDVLIGGFHFSKLALDGALADAAKTLAAMDTDFYTCHCTGEEQYRFMKQYMPRLSYLGGGRSIEI